MKKGNGDHSSPEERFRAGVRLLHQGQVEEARALLEPLYERDSENVEIALNLGGAYILQGRYAEAERILVRAADAAPDNEHVWVNLAAARLGPLEESSEAQQDQAIQAYEKALLANPDVANVHYMLGLIYRGRGDDLRAAAHFTRALEQNAQDNDARRMLAAIARDHTTGRGED